MNTLLSQTRDFLKTHSADVAKDQFFLIDPLVIAQLLDSAPITSDDRVLEVGPGLGFITKALAKRAKEVVCIEIDQRFKPFLDELPANVQIIYGNAYKLVNNEQFRSKTKAFTKMVSSIPYSQAQNMLHNYTNYSWYQGDLVWLAPKSLATKINKDPILGAYFNAQLIADVSKTAFFPQPNTASAIIYFRRIENPIKTKDFANYMRRYIYNHEHLKVKNALREGIIDAAWDLKRHKVTKNQARGLVAKLPIDTSEFDKLTSNIKPEYYFTVCEGLTNWFDSL